MKKKGIQQFISGIHHPDLSETKNGRIITPGGYASTIGKSHEKMIEQQLKSFNLIYIPQYKYTGIYECVVRLDYYVKGVPGFEKGLGIESKYQGSSGSADEKFPYLVKNIKECLPFPCIIIYSLEGARPEAVSWLCNQVDDTHLIGTFKLDQFISWIHRKMLPYE